jgi:hypothetical protein
MEILNFFLFLLVIFALLDPDPQFECGSGSATLPLSPSLYDLRDPDHYSFIQDSMIREIWVRSLGSVPLTNGPGSKLK